MARQAPSVAPTTGVAGHRIVLDRGVNVVSERVPGTTTWILAPYTAIREALEAVSAADAPAWFARCGYQLPAPATPEQSL